MLAACASALKHFLYSGLSSLPDGAKIAIVTFDKALHFYSLHPSLEQFQMMVVGDVDEPFVPLDDGFLVDPYQSK